MKSRIEEFERNLQQAVAQGKISAEDARNRTSQINELTNFVEESELELEKIQRESEKIQREIERFSFLAEQHQNHAQELRRLNEARQLSLDALYQAIVAVYNDIVESMPSKSITASLLIGMGALVAGYSIPITVASMTGALFTGQITNFIRRKFSEHFHDKNTMNASDANELQVDSELLSYIELGKEGQRYWSEYLKHTVTAPRSLLIFTDEGQAYQYGRHQANETEELAPTRDNHRFR